MQDYHNLHVWQRAHAFVLEIRQTADGFPSGFANIRNQIISATESIAFNLVEGCGAGTRAEFARFVDISIKSTNEVQYQLELARDYHILSAERWEKLTAEIIEIRKCCTASGKHCEQTPPFRGAGVAVKSADARRRGL